MAVVLTLAIFTTKKNHVWGTSVARPARALICDFPTGLQKEILVMLQTRKLWSQSRRCFVPVHTDRKSHTTVGVRLPPNGDSVTPANAVSLPTPHMGYLQVVSFKQENAKEVGTRS